jgi:hypothetical protein
MREQLAGYALVTEKQLSQYALNQEKQFSQSYFRALYGVSITLYIYYIGSNEFKALGISVLLVGSSWILPMNESNRLDIEIKRRAIIRDVLLSETV